MTPQPNTDEQREEYTGGGIRPSTVTFVAMLAVGYPYLFVLFGTTEPGSVMRIAGGVGLILVLGAIMITGMLLLATPGDVQRVEEDLP